MATYNLVEAGAAVGRTKSAILKAIQRGAISASRNTATGGWAIEPAELHRVFPPVSGDTSGDRQDTADTGEIRELRARVADAQETIADLRHRFDIATQQLGDALQQVRALTDQRPGTGPRRWWRFGR